MKSLFLILLLSTFSTNAQTGAVQFKFEHLDSATPVSVCVSILKDSSFQKLGCADSAGRFVSSSLSLGANTFQFHWQDSLLGQTLVFVQQNQLLLRTVQVDTATHSFFASDGSAFRLGLNGQKGMNEQLRATAERRLTGSVSLSSGVQEIQMVMCSANRVRLLDHGSLSLSTISRSDMSTMPHPMRQPLEMATTISSVQSSSDGNSVNIRGSRSDATVYYLDGFRVNSIQNIPKTFIGSIDVYTSGIPANYGDATGGVIHVHSLTRQSLVAQRERQLREKYYATYYEAPAAPEIEKPIPQFNTLLEKVGNRFTPIYENVFLFPKENPHSTFGIDVDRASWTYLKNYYQIEINRDAVKLEEMINAFHYDEVRIPENEMIGVSVTRSECSWNEDHELVTVHLKAKDVPTEFPRNAHNFVFLIDVSGSMQGPQKMDLLKSGLTNFVATLREDDRVAIVTYAGHVGVALESTSDKTAIFNALDNLTSGGSTNGMGGIQMAYDLAEKQFDSTKNNRIILCTDGDFNVGISSPDSLENYITTKRGQGIYLTALGFGFGNYRNDVLETLADRGDGNHFYINNDRESNKVLVQEIGNLLNLARDVKIDVAFDTSNVCMYRLLGYENRLLAPEDFANDAIDAGEMGYGHEVTAVYEIEYCDSRLIKDDTIAIVRLRYKPLEEENSIEKEHFLTTSERKEPGLKLNVVIGLGLVLRDSAFKGNLTTSSLRKLTSQFTPENEEEVELKEMILALTEKPKK